MIPEKVLEELKRDSSLSEIFVKALWKDLAVESKLEIVGFGKSDFDYIPDWLMKICLEDQNEFLRYWAAKNYYFQRKDLDHPDRRQPSDLQDSITRAAEEDPGALVRSVVTYKSKSSIFDLPNLSSFDQVTRLLFIRNITQPNLEHFIEWLENATHENMDAYELYYCIREFFKNPHVGRYLTQPTYEIEDGYDAYSRGKGMERGWEFVKSAPPLIGRELAGSLPIRLGLSTISTDQFVQLPEHALSLLIFRWEFPEIREVIQHIRSHPENFSEEIKKRAASISEGDYIAVSDGEREKQKRFSSVEHQQTTLEMLFELKQELSNIREDIKGLQAQKRGFFS